MDRCHYDDIIVCKNVQEHDTGLWNQLMQGTRRNYKSFYLQMHKVAVNAYIYRYIVSSDDTSSCDFSVLLQNYNTQLNIDPACVLQSFSDNVKLFILPSL